MWPRLQHQHQTSLSTSGVHPLHITGKRSSKRPYSTLNMADSTLPLFQNTNLNLQTNYQNRSYVLKRLVILSHQPLWEDGWCLQMGSAEEAWGLLWSPLPATGSVSTRALSSTPVIIFPATQCYNNIVNIWNRFHSHKIFLCGRSWRLPHSVKKQVIMHPGTK